MHTTYVRAPHPSVNTSQMTQREAMQRNMSKHADIELHALHPTNQNTECRHVVATFSKGSTCILSLLCPATLVPQKVDEDFFLHLHT